jgi:hypothetical protein
VLTRDDTWISFNDIVGRFSEIPEALPEAQLRAQMLNYFGQHLSLKPTKKIATRQRLPYSTSTRSCSTTTSGCARTQVTRPNPGAWTRSTRRWPSSSSRSSRSSTTSRLKLISANAAGRATTKRWPGVESFKQYIENQDGWKLINRQGEPFSKEKDVQLYFGLVWFGSIFDINRETNNGRGSVDYKVSIGAADKSLIEFKLASNSQLKRNLEKQVEIYEKANQTATSVTVIICYTEADQAKVKKLLTELELNEREDLVVIDARSDNKPTGSNA